MQTTPDDINSDLDRYLERHPLTGRCPYDTTTATHNRHRVELRQHHYAADNNPTWSVCCLTCGAESPPEHTHQDAIHVFNSRDGRPLPIVKPAPVMVPLGPEDVPPFSLIRRKGQTDEYKNPQYWHWRLISYVTGIGPVCADRGYNWQELSADYEINRSLAAGKWDPTAWERCEKEEVQP